MGKGDKNQGNDAGLTKKQLKQALTKFGADQEQRLSERLQAISNQVNMTLSGTKSVLSDHAVRINALTDFVCANLAEISVMLDGLWEQTGKVQDQLVTGKSLSGLALVPKEHLDALRDTIREKIAGFQTELKAYQEHARKTMGDMVKKAQESIKPPEAEEPKTKRIDLSDELPMDESLQMGPGKAE